MLSDAKRQCAHTDAEAFARRLSDLGASVFMTVQPDGRPFLTFEFSVLPPTPRASDLAALIRHRFTTDERFRKDLFGFLLAEGHLHQRFGHPNPLPLAEGLGSPAELQAVSR